MPEYQPSRVIEYNDIYFSCIHQRKLKERFTLSDHSLIYIKSGLLEIEYPSSTLTILPGQCVFVRKDSNLTLANTLMDKHARVYPFLQQGGRHCEEDWRAQTEAFMHFLWLE